MKIASWNVNSLKVRLPHLEAWLAARQPDVLVLQETKCEDAAFPAEAIRGMGYQVAYAGQKTYNGVAVLAKGAIEDVQVGIPGFEDEQKRVIAATIDGVRVVDLYVVNGKAVGDEKYAYKLRWLEALHGWIGEEIARHPRLAVLGDFNIAPDDRDVHDPEGWRDQILCSPPEREALGRLLALGLHDSFRLFNDEAGHFSWWDYRAAGFRRNLGLRIDLALISDALKPHCVGSVIDREPRAWERPSDHAPVVVELALG